MKIDINKLSIEEKIGQMLMIGMTGTKIDKRIEDLIIKYKIGGLILYRKNFSTYNDLVNLINELKKLNRVNKIPLFIAIDQEGGRVNRMPDEILNLPSANKIAMCNDIELVKKASKITGQMLKQTGFNMNFSPVLDIKRFENNHAIGDRCYGDNEKDVIKYGIEVMKALQEEKVISVVKHFPGHGSTLHDSHFLLPIVNRKIKELEKEDMKPFEEAIKQGTDAIMVAHMIVSDVNKAYPVSLSNKFITNYLRKKYRYNGLVITDDLRMRAIRYIYGPKFATQKAFLAGNDIIMLRFNHRDEIASINKVIKMAKQDKIKLKRINKSVKRIINLKEKYQINDDEVIGCNIDEVNSKIENIKKQVDKL